MTLTRPVELPGPASAGNGLLALSGGLGDGWTRGVTFASPICLMAGSHQFCSTSPGSPAEKVFHESDVASFVPFGVEVSVQCSTLSSFTERRNQARAVLGFVAERAVGRVLATGLISNGDDTGNPNLLDATVVGGGLGHAAALSVLEGFIAANLRGQRATVHVAPSDLVLLAAASAVRYGFDGWVTPGGHLVISSAGYTPLAGMLFASGDVFTMLGEPDEVSTVDRSDNRNMVMFESPAIAVFDPCFNIAATIDTESPGEFPPGGGPPFF